MTTVKGVIEKYKWVCIFALSLLHLCITFVTDKNIFTFPPVQEGVKYTATTDYVICKCITFLVLFAVYYGLYILVIGAGDKHEALQSVLKLAAIYVPVVIGVLAIKLPGGYITNDENIIYGNAVSLTHDTWFYYLTTYYYVVSLMIVPFKYGPIIIKAIIQLLAAGYVVYRIRDYYGKKVGLIGYVLFLLYPVIAYTSSAHRLPVYFLLYLVIMTKWLFDGLKGHNVGRLEMILILVIGAVLTQWRTEGIYFAVLLPILCLLTYANIRNKKSVAVLIILTIAIQYIVSIPQNGFTAKNLDGAANDRMKPFYAYTITNMYRNGLDLEKNADDLAIVDKYLSLDVIDAINEYYGDINYEDVLILYQEGYVGVREEATVQDFINYSDAVKRIFVNNPDVFMRTRWGAFCYAALPYRITFSGMGLRSLISFSISIVKTISYNLFIPFIISILLCIYALIRRRWYSFFAFGGLICHWFIVFVLAPASYFKYYFPIYIISYFYVIIIAIYMIIKNKKETGVSSPVR